ncbi:protein phosphatase 2C family, partial [Kipferlia bialata]
LSNQFLGGSTALSAVVTDETIWVANAGDSRCVYIPRGDMNSCLSVTEDHKPNNDTERERVEAVGSRVVPQNWGNVYRVAGLLSVARAIGDQ